MSGECSKPLPGGKFEGREGGSWWRGEPGALGLYTGKVKGADSGDSESGSLGLLALDGPSLGVVGLGS